MLAMTAMQANELRHAGGFPTPQYFWGCAVDKDFHNRACAYSIVNGTDLMFTILDENMKIEKQFTIKDAVKENSIWDEYDQEWYNEQEWFLHPTCLHMNTYFYFVHYDNCLLTQTFYNNDEKWEVLMVEEDGKGYGIYNEDGVRLGSAPCIHEDDYVSPMGFLIVNDIVYFYDWTNDQFYTYNENAGNAVAELPVAASKAYPNPLRHGDTLTIEMENGLDGTFKVEVIDMKGTRLYSAEKEAKNGVIKVPSVRLHKGWNIYTVKDGDEIIEKGKILVK